MAGKSGKGGRKVGRGARSPARAAYKKMGKTEINKKKKISKHLKKHIGDFQSVHVLKKAVDYGKKLTAKEIIEKQWQCYLKGVI